MHCVLLVCIVLLLLFITKLLVKNYGSNTHRHKYCSVRPKIPTANYRQPISAYGT
jgi:hypothetical protein